MFASSSNNNNNSAQSNLEKGPRRGTVAHVCRKVPTGYNGVPKIHPQKYPFPWTYPKTALSASSLDPSDLRRQMAPGSNLPFFDNALDRPTHIPTDCLWESLIITGRCTLRVTRCNKQCSRKWVPESRMKLTSSMVALASISRRQLGDGLKTRLFLQAYTWSTENLIFRVYLLTYLLTYNITEQNQNKQL